MLKSTYIREEKFVILISECLPRGCAVFSLVLTCFSRKVNKDTHGKIKELEEERFLLLSNPKTGGKLVKNWKKTDCISFFSFSGNPGKNEDLETNSNLVSL